MDVMADMEEHIRSASLGPPLRRAFKASGLRSREGTGASVLEPSVLECSTLHLRSWFSFGSMLFGATGSLEMGLLDRVI